MIYFVNVYKLKLWNRQFHYKFNKTRLNQLN